MPVVFYTFVFNSTSIIFLFFFDLSNTQRSTFVLKKMTWPIFVVVVFCSLQWNMDATLCCLSIDGPFAVQSLSINPLKQLLICVTLTKPGGWFSLLCFPQPPFPLLLYCRWAASLESMWPETWASCKTRVDWWCSHQATLLIYANVELWPLPTCGPDLRADDPKPEESSSGVLVHCPIPSVF